MVGLTGSLWCLEPLMMHAYGEASLWSSSVVEDSIWKLQSQIQRKVLYGKRGLKTNKDFKLSNMNNMHTLVLYPCFKMNIYYGLYVYFSAFLRALIGLHCIFNNKQTLNILQYICKFHIFTLSF